MCPPLNLQLLRSDDEEFELDDVFDEEIQVTAVRHRRGSQHRGGGHATSWVFVL